MLKVIADTFAPNDPIINYISSNGRTPSFAITAEAGSTVKVYDVTSGSSLLGTASESTFPGIFTYTAPELAPGTHLFAAQSTDPLGNTSPTSAALTSTLI
jgi:hypothetical protein